MPRKRLELRSKKPLLLLLLVSRIENGQVAENRFDFSDVRRELDTLIRCFGGGPPGAGLDPSSRLATCEVRLSGRFTRRNVTTAARPCGFRT